MGSLITTRPVFIIYLFLLLAVMGTGIATQLPISIYPPIDKPTIRVTQNFSQDSHDFYINYGQKIERSFRTIENVEDVEATYTRGKAVFFVNFSWNANSQSAKRDVETIASFYQAQLPKYLPATRVDFFDPASENYVAFKSTQLDTAALSSLIKNALIPKLEGIEGVGAAWVSDASSQQVLIKLKPYAMMKYGVSLATVINTLTFNEVDIDLGRLKSEDTGDIGINFKLGYTSVAEISAIELKSIAGNKLLIKDIADVRLEKKDADRFFYFNDEEVIAVAIWPEPGANMYEVSRQFIELTQSFSRESSDILVINNPKQFIEEAIINILLAIALGMAIAAVVVLCFYRKLSSVLFICISMPLCLVISILVMRVLGVGINLLSLGAMSISIGMVVDSSILVIDSLVYQQQQNKGKIDLLRLIQSMTNEIRPSIITSTLTSIVVFLPLAFTEPLTATLLKDLALVTVSILVTSLFVSLFFIPALFLVLKPQAQSKLSGQSNNGISVYFLRLINVIPTAKWVFPFVILSACIYTVVELIPKIDLEVVAQPKAQIIDVHVLFNATGLAPDRKMAIIRPLRQEIEQLAADKLKFIYIDVRKNDAYLSLHVKNYDDNAQLLKALSSIDEKLFNAELSYEPWITSSLKIKDYPARELLFTSASDSQNRTLLIRAKAIVKASQNINRVKIKPSDRQVDEVNLNLKSTTVDSLLDDRGFARELDQLTLYVKHAVAPQKLTDITTEQGDFPVYLSVSEQSTKAFDILDTPYEINGHKAFIGDLVTLSATRSWREFYSVNTRPTFSLQLWSNPGVTEAQIDQLVALLRAELGDNSFAETNPSTEMVKGLESIVTAFIFSIVSVFLVVLYHFKTVARSLAVMSVVLFGITGSVVSLYVFESTLSLNSMLGMLILVGLSVNNSILILDFYQKNQAPGKNSINVIGQSISRRFRSLLVTNLTTFAGMLPLAVGFGPGQDILKPLGISVSGGLLIATGLTIIVFPVILLWFKPLHSAKISTPISPSALIGSTR